MSSYINEYWVLLEILLYHSRTADVFFHCSNDSLSIGHKHPLKNVWVTTSETSNTSNAEIALSYQNIYIETQSH